ncbi:MAG: 16S rRNA (adenine(1518)-N(6)/adenine(1519)-N(6))-dimethyltransferase RsmA [Hyphomonadaceae bacterium]
MREPPPIREALERHGLWAKKSLGQHFLLDLNLTRRIAKSAGDLDGKPVLEIGPGPGGLTRALLEAGADPLIVIEKDARFIPLLQELLPYSDNRLKIIEADALELHEEDLLAGHAAHIVSNLPYNVGTPLLIKWLKAGPWRGPMTLMFQKEVANRIAAEPRDDAYGRLSVIAQARCYVHKGMTVHAHAFTPPPKVDSAIVHLEDRTDAYPHLNDLERVTAAAFGQRRKMLRQSLASLAGELGLPAEMLLSKAGVAPTARAEEIALQGFIALSEAVRALRGR